METSFLSHSDADTRAFGERLAAMLPEGAFIALDGELGVGKTVFVKGFAKGLGIQENILSPTFTLLREYEGTCKLFHFDVYRIEDEDELTEIGFEEYIRTTGVTIVEWASRIPGLLPEERVSIEITRVEAAEERLIRIAATGEYKNAVKAAMQC